MTVIMLYAGNVPITYRTMFTVPNIALMNIMACRVFRNTKLGLNREASSFFNSKASRTDAQVSGAIPLSLRHNQLRSNGHTLQAAVNVTKTIDVEHDYDMSDKDSGERDTKERDMV